MCSVFAYRLSACRAALIDLLWERERDDPLASRRPIAHWLQSLFMPKYCGKAPHVCVRKWSGGGRGALLPRILDFLGAWEGMILFEAGILYLRFP